MEGRLSSGAKPFISKFTRHAQVSIPEKKLTKALVKKQDYQDEIERQRDSSDQRWRVLFESDERQVHLQAEAENEEVDQAGRRVLLAWLKFQKGLPEQESINIRDKPPTFALLSATVEAAQTSLEEKRASSTIKARFRKICSSINDYEDLAKVIPSNDKYVSIVTGAVGALIKATVNHEEIANGISEGLTDIADDISYWARLLDRHSMNPKMRSYIRDLYAIVFECFADIFTEWHKSRWTRIIGSFNKNLLKTIVSGHRKRMQDLSEKLKREAALDHTAAFSDFTSDFNRFVDENQKNQRLLGIRQNEDREECRNFIKTLGEDRMRGWQEELRLWLTGGAGQQLLEAAFVSRGITPPPQQMQEAPRRTMGGIEPSSEETNFDQTKPSSVIYTRARLQDYTRHLGLQTSQPAPEMPMISAAQLHLHANVYDALKKWSSSSTSQYLWIEGPADVETPSQNTLTSMSLVGIAQKSQTVHLAYFAQPSRARKAADRPQHCSHALISLVYTLLSQLVDQLPPAFESAADLSAARFTCLDGSESGLTSATQLLPPLLEATTGPLLCLIDGLQHLSYGASRETIAGLRRLLELLGASAGPRDRLVRVCVTTDGYVEMLATGRMKGLLQRVCCDDDGDGEDAGEGYPMEDLT